MRLIALEEHILPPHLREAWAAAPPPRDPVFAVADGGQTGKRLADLGAGRLTLMDERGVDVQVLSLTTPGLHNLEQAPAVEAAVRVDDLIADACARRPDRFQGLAALPTSDPDAAPRELERAVRELGLKGALLRGRTRERRLDRPGPAADAGVAARLGAVPHDPAGGGEAPVDDAAGACFGCGGHASIRGELRR